MAPSAQPKVLTARLLRNWPLPQPGEGGDKEERGRVLVVGGASEMPGALILAATAVLRAGAGKLQIATSQTVAPLIAAHVPEARVFALPETKSGAVVASAADLIAEHANKVHALLVGPGMIEESIVTRLMKNVVPQLHYPVLIADAAAMSFLGEAPHALAHLHQQAIITPHGGEMAGLLGIEKKEIAGDAPAVARRAAREFKCVVALKGRETIICDARNNAYVNRTGNVGLAISGSGDTLSGIIAGLAARGAAPIQAAAWGVYLHGSAGDKLARSMGPLGFLPRELLAEVPALMATLGGLKKVGKR
ncbi:MAG TPA: NAD(P)H-hydrate dehydratase [Pyrinomonadaceae bacterium]|jgi:hydroxyethylthiazole kinase-like uncharacterized protein yjeF|nr:NAD(P)H-hydrate dehydratase [Pyrinomonadaceae bacterium]